MPERLAKHASPSIARHLAAITRRRCPSMISACQMRGASSTFGMFGGLSARNAEPQREGNANLPSAARHARTWQRLGRRRVDERQRARREDESEVSRGTYRELTLSKFLSFWRQL